MCPGILSSCESLCMSMPDGHLNFDPIRIHSYLSCGQSLTSSVLLLCNYFHKDDEIKHMVVLQLQND